MKKLVNREMTDFTRVALILTGAVFASTSKKLSRRERKLVINLVSQVAKPKKKKLFK